MISQARPGLEREVCLAESSILKSELNSAAVDARAFTISLVSEPRDAAVQLTLDCGRSLWVSVALVKEKRSSSATVVCKLARNGMSRCELEVETGIKLLTVTWWDSARTLTSKELARTKAVATKVVEKYMNVNLLREERQGR